MKKITLNVMNIPYHGRNHAERAVPEYPESLIILFIIVKLLYVLISQVPNSPSHAIIMDPFTRNFTTVNTYFYVICQCSTYS